MIKPGWTETLPIDPLPSLSAGKGLPLSYFARRDLHDEPVGPIDALCECPAALAILRKQQANGSWRYPGANRKAFPVFNYALLETFRNLRVLVEMYGFTKLHPAITRAAEYVFSCQTAEGDIRGIIGNQYMPYYHAALLALLIKAGCGQDQRLENGMNWLLTMRQQDGGWIVPAQAVPASQKNTTFWKGEPVPPARDRPFSHLATGMVLRAFAAHPHFSRSEAAWQAGTLLKERFFLPDKYNDRKTPGYWLKFEFPFWWNNLLSALDSLSRLGFSHQDEQICKGINWFLTHQESDGLWPTSYGSGKNAAQNRSWVGLAICRMLKRFWSKTALN
jgi:hypothetical protein